MTGGRSPNNGYLEYFHENTWRPFCARLWDMNYANVACNDLGYDGAIGFHLKDSSDFSKKGIWFENFTCNGSENFLLWCSFERKSLQDCSTWVWIRCKIHGKVDRCTGVFALSINCLRQVFKMKENENISQVGK